jgi:hypothetical protein
MACSRARSGGVRISENVMERSVRG